MSDSLDDPFISDLMDEYGHLGYTIWFGILEIIAKENGAKLTGKIEISPTYLRRKLRTSTTKLQQVLDFCQTYVRLSVTFSKKRWIIDCPKLLEIKDNYIKDLQVTGKKPSNHKEVEKEVEEEKDSFNVSDDTDQSKKVEKKTGKTEAPDPKDFVISDATYKNLKKWNFKTDDEILDMVEHCFDWYRSHGKRQADWQAVLRNWAKNQATKFKPRNKPSNGKTNKTFMEIAQEMDPTLGNNNDIEVKDYEIT